MEQLPTKLASAVCPMSGPVLARRLYELPFGDILECSSCRLVFANDSILSTPPVCEYDAGYFRRPGAGTHLPGYIDYFGAEWSPRQIVGREIGDLLAGLFDLPSRRLLDIGCGAGHVVAALAAKGWDARGVDVSADAIKVAHRRYDGLSLACSEASRFLERSRTRYDVVLMCDVIEHLARPLSLLGQVRTALSPGGGVFLVTPRFGGRLSSTQGRNYEQFKPDHVSYYTANTLRMALEMAGFRAVRVATMPDLLRRPPGPIGPALVEKYVARRDHLFAWATA